MSEGFEGLEECACRPRLSRHHNGLVRAKNFKFRSCNMPGHILPYEVGIVDNLVPMMHHVDVGHPNIQLSVQRMTYHTNPPVVILLINNFSVPFLNTFDSLRQTLPSCI